MPTLGYDGRASTSYQISFLPRNGQELILSLCLANVHLDRRDALTELKQRVREHVESSNGSNEPHDPLTIAMSRGDDFRTFDNPLHHLASDGQQV